MFFSSAAVLLAALYLLSRGGPDLPGFAEDGISLKGEWVWENEESIGLLRFHGLAGVCAQTHRGRIETYSVVVTRYLYRSLEFDVTVHPQLRTKVRVFATLDDSMLHMRVDRIDPDDRWTAPPRRLSRLSETWIPELDRLRHALDELEKIQD